MKLRHLLPMHVVIVLISCVVMLFGSMPGMAATLEQVGQGQVDWETGVIRVKGNGVAPANMTLAQAKLMSRRAAVADAYRNALESIQGIRLSSETYVKDFMTVSDEIRNNVNGFIKGALVEDSVYDIEGNCEVTVVMSLGGNGGFSRLVSGLAKEAAAKQSSAVVPLIQPAPATGSSPQTQPAPLTQSAVVTGIVVDARGLDIKPAMYPQIFDSKGNLLFGPTKIDVDAAASSTISAYSRSLEAAKSLPRVGAHPLVVKANGSIRSKTGDKTDVTIDSTTAVTVLDAESKSRVLSGCKVVIVID